MIKLIYDVLCTLHVLFASEHNMICELSSRVESSQVGYMMIILKLIAGVKMDTSWFEWNQLIS